MIDGFYIEERNINPKLGIWLLFNLLRASRTDPLKEIPRKNCDCDDKNKYFYFYFNDESSRKEDMKYSHMYSALCLKHGYEPYGKVYLFEKPKTLKEAEIHIKLMFVGLYEDSK